MARPTASYRSPCDRLRDHHQPTPCARDPREARRGNVRQEQVIGRTKEESVELEDKAAESHVTRTDQDRFGKIFRRNMAYGTVTDHGTMFVGFSAEQQRLTAMLESMAGLTDGVRDALTNYARPLTGAYYFVPSTQSLRRCGGT